MPLLTPAERSERFEDARCIYNVHGSQEQKEVDKATGVSHKKISAMENADVDRDFGYRDIATLAEYYDVPVGFLMGTENVYRPVPELKEIERLTNLSNKSVEKLAYSSVELSRVHKYLDMLLSSDGFDKLLYALLDVSDAIRNAEFSIKNAERAALDQGNTELAAKYAQERLEMTIWKAQKAISDICYELFPIKESEDKLLSVRKDAHNGEHKES